MSAIYISNKNKNVFCVNLKVGFSTFESLHKAGFLSKISSSSTEFKNNPAFVIVRDPLSRLVSFYNHWVIDVKKNHEFKTFCQHQLTAVYEKDFIISKQFTFSNLVHAINMKTKYFFINKHLVPQYRIHQDISSVNNNVNYIKIEDSKFNSITSKLIGVDHLARVNSSSKNRTHPDAISLDRVAKSDIATVEKLYKKDYEIFNYKNDIS